VIMDREGVMRYYNFLCRHCRKPVTMEPAPWVWGSYFCSRGCAEKERRYHQQKREQWGDAWLTAESMVNCMQLLVSTRKNIREG